MEWFHVNWEFICILFGILVNLAGLVYNVYKFCRSGRAKVAHNWLAVLEAARQYEKEAEGFPEYSSAEKLQYVLSRLRIFTAKLGCEYDEERLVAQIEADIAFSKEVNADKSARLE